MTTWLHKKVEEWLSGPCVNCDDKKTAAGDSQPAYIQPYLDTLTGPNEQHEAPNSGTCMNPKCHHNFTPQEAEEAEWTQGWIKCPECGFRQNLNTDLDEGTKVWTSEGINPGGLTRSGLTLTQMGDLGEAIVLRLGELPGIGTIAPASNQQKFPIDAIIAGQKGKFGVEIKANHSQARQRFKVGGKKERQEKIEYCLTNGLKPALVGVRLNFYTNQAYVFFREGLTDTWVGNQQMHHVGTYDFEDINPFKSPDPQAQALAVDNAELPDQSEEDEFDALFGTKETRANLGNNHEFAKDGWVTLAFEDEEHPRDTEGKFTFKHDVHEVAVKDKKGKHTHTLKRCAHCGTLYGKHAEHHGRVECPTCGEDAERKLNLASIILAADNADAYAKQLGWNYLGVNREGHRRYNWQDPSGVQHMVQVGGKHNKGKEEMSAQFARQRMTKCMNGKCGHVELPEGVSPEGEPGQPVFKTGQTITTNGQYGIVLETNGEASLVQNYQTQQKGWVPNQQLQAVSRWRPSSKK